MSQPSLRITHVEDQTPPGDYIFEVWNPQAARYESCNTLEDAMDRVGQLAQTMRALWVEKSEILAALSGPPPVTGNTEFAELRVTSLAQRHYDLRSFDSPEWSHFRGYISQGVERICGEVGYVLSPLTAPAPPAQRMQATAVKR